MEQRVTEPVAVGIGAGQQVRRWRHQMARLARTQPLGTLALVICLIMVFMAVFAPLVSRYDPFATSAYDRLLAPSATHWFGTDENGRDLYARLVYGARISMYVAFFSIAIGTFIGYLAGIVSGFVGGKIDDYIQRVVDAMLAFPSILLALTVVSVLGAGLDKVIAAIAITLAPRAARVSRGVVLSVKENVYIDAARVIGASSLRIMLRHVLPNTMAPFLVLASVALGGAILTEASLSFLGLGVPPPHPAWGRMLSGASQNLGLLAPWLMIFPGAAIMLLVLAFNLLGDALRDIWDPKLRGR